MVKIVSYASMLLVAGGLTVGSAVFAGMAAAEPSCQGEIPMGSAHTPFEVGSASTAGCSDALDGSDTSMIDMAEAGSFPGGSDEYTFAPWTHIH